MFKFVCLFALLATSATASQQSTEADSLLTSALRMVKDCGDRSVVLCLKVSKYQCCLKKKRKQK